MYGVNDGLHAFARLSNNVSELVFHSPNLLQAKQLGTLLEQPPVERCRYLVITKVLLHDQLFIIHLFLNQSRLLHCQHLQ